MAVYQRFNHTVRDNQGNVVNGASCAVYDVSTGALATIYDPASDDASPVGISNPFITGPAGVFGFMAADGVYDVKITGGKIASQPLRVKLLASADPDNTLRGDIASTASGKGAALVGFSKSTDYASGTIGSKAKSIPDAPGGPLYCLKAALDSGQTCAIQVLSDSTANDTTDWPYILGQQIAASYPNYTVDWILWDDTNQIYGAPTRIQTGTAGERYLDCASGTHGFRLDNSVNTSLPTGELDISAQVEVSNWVPAAQQFFMVLGTSAPNLGFRFFLHTDGKLGFLWTPDGTSALAVYSTVATGLSAGTKKWVRVVFTPNDGGGNRVAKFYTSDNGVTWTQLGTTVTTAGATSVFSPSGDYPFAIGGGYNNSATLTKVHRVRLRDAANGRVVLPVMPDLWSPWGLGTNMQMAGAPVLTIVCGAKAGANIAYLGDATRLPKMVPQYGQAITFLSDSHNEAYLTGGYWGSVFKTWADSVKAALPSSGICAMTQNPETSSAPLYVQHARRRYDLLSLKGTNGMEVLDTYQAFIDAGWPGALMADSVHPNLAGSTVWATYVKKRIDQTIG